MSNQLFGIAGFGKANGSQTVYNKIAAISKSWISVTDWGEIELSENNFDWTAMDNRVTKLYNSGLFIMLKIYVAGTDATITPQYLYDNGVPQVVMQENAAYIYPYYLNTYYRSRYQNLLDQFLIHLSTYSAEVRAKIIAYQITEGSTGDTVPYHGTPTNPAYIITSDDWLTYRRFYWSYMYPKIIALSPTVQMIINVGNDGFNISYVNSNHPLAGWKRGDLGHNYGWPGEKNYAQSTRNHIGSGLIFRSENGFPAWWSVSPNMNTFAILFSALHSNLNVFNILGITYPINTTTDYAYNLFTEYTEQWTVKEKAIIQFRDEIDVADSVRFPVVTYGALIDPAFQSLYDTLVATINGSSDPQEAKDTQITKLNVQYRNLARDTAIKAIFPQSSYQPIDKTRNGNAYLNDYNVNGFDDNCSIWMQQYDPDNTSDGWYRIGVPLVDFHGRYCRSPKPEMFISIDAQVVGNFSYKVSFDIHYYNEGTGSWSLNYWDGTKKVSAFTVTNTGLNLWQVASVTIESFYGGGNLPNATDYTIKTESGAATKFSLVEFLRISHNVTPPPIGVVDTYCKIGNIPSTICSRVEQHIYTDGDFVAGKILYTDEALTMRLLGYNFVVNVNDNIIYNVDNETGVLLSQTLNTCSQWDYIPSKNVYPEIKCGC